MKTTVAGAVAALVIGLAIAAPFIIVLVVMIAPLVMLATASGWEFLHGGSRTTDRRESGIDDRHVVTPVRPH
jgi:membrane protein implicated in regulation of membrane protease activity